MAVRARVVASEFGTQTGPDGEPYTGISLCPAPELVTSLTQLVGGRIKVNLSAFRLNLEKDPLKSFIHADLICSQYATVAYFNTPEQCWGGTAFWKHRQHGWNAMPTTAEIEAAGMERGPAYVSWMQVQWHTARAWELESLIGMRFNRCIVYPTELFHSRYPWEAWGHGPKDGRLIWVCFFDRV